MTPLLQSDLILQQEVLRSFTLDCRELLHGFESESSQGLLRRQAFEGMQILCRAHRLAVPLHIHHLRLPHFPQVVEGVQELPLLAAPLHKLDVLK